MTTNFSPEYQAALSEVADRWVPACGGLDLGTDLILEQNELPSFLRS